MTLLKNTIDPAYDSIVTYTSRSPTSSKQPPSAHTWEAPATSSDQHVCTTAESPQNAPEQLDGIGP